MSKISQITPLSYSKNSFNVKYDKSISFKAVGINTSTLKKMAEKSEIDKEISKIHDMIVGGAFKSLQELEETFISVTEKMGLKREEIDNRPWYKSFRNKSRHQKVNKEEIATKDNILKIKNLVVEEAKKQATKVEEFADNYSTLVSNNAGAQMILRLRENNLQDNIRGMTRALKGFSKIAGYKDEQNILNNYFIKEINKEKMGLPANVPGSILFFGPTGNGKSTFARAFADETSCNFVVIKKILTSSSHSQKDTQKLFMKNLLDVAKKSEENFQQSGIRTIIFMDEITKVAEKDSPILRHLNKFLDKCSEKYHCTLFAATNYPSNIALRMHGENSVFPYRVALEPPNLANKIEILKFYAQKRTKENLDYTALAKEMEKIEQDTGHSFSVSQIRNIANYDERNSLLSQINLVNAIRQQNPTIDKEHLTKFNNEIKEFILNEVHV